MLRGVFNPLLAPGALLYMEIWDQGSQPLWEVRKALAWELCRDEERLPGHVAVKCTPEGFEVIVQSRRIFDRLLDYSDMIFIGDGCYVLAFKGPRPALMREI